MASIHENAPENVLCNMAPILLRSQWVKERWMVLKDDMTQNNPSNDRPSVPAHLRFHVKINIKPSFLACKLHNAWWGVEMQ